MPFSFVAKAVVQSTTADLAHPFPPFRGFGTLGPSRQGVNTPGCKPGIDRASHGFLAKSTTGWVVEGGGLEKLTSTKR